MTTAAKKPWEQEWKRNGLGHIEATDAIQVEVKTAFWRVPEGEAEAFRQVEETQQFVLAAPDMARALMLVLQSNKHTTYCNNTTSHSDPCSEDCESVRDALRKAGVPL